jgi:hypothetical protein
MSDDSHSFNAFCASYILHQVFKCVPAAAWPIKASVNACKVELNEAQLLQAAHGKVSQAKFWANFAFGAHCMLFL